MRIMWILAARLLSKADNSIFHFFTCDHHRFTLSTMTTIKGSGTCFISDWALYYLGIKASNITSTHFREEPIAIFHLNNDLLQGSTSLGVGWSPLGSKGENIIVDRKLPPSLIDYHKLDFVRSAH